MVDIVAGPHAAAERGRSTSLDFLHPSTARGLELVEKLLHAEVQRMRVAGIPVGEDEFRGLYISESEADRLLGASHPARLPNGAVDPDGPLAARRAEFEEFAASMTGPPGELASLAGLSAFEVGCLLLCLAADEDAGFQRLIAYAQDHVSRRRPCVELLIRIFSGPDATGRARAAFDVDAPLRRWRLVTLHEEPGQPHTPLPGRSVALDGRIAGFLLGQQGMDETLHPHAEFSATLAASCHPALPALLRERLASLAALPATTLRPPIVHLAGPDPVRMRTVAGELADGAGLGLLTVSLPGLGAEAGLEAALVLAGREAALRRAAVLLTGLEQLKAEDADRLRTLAGETLLAPLVILASSGSFSWPGLSIDVPALEFDERRTLWRSQLGDAPAIAPDVLDDVTGKFRLSTRGIEDAARAAQGSALWRDPSHPVVEVDDLYVAARAQSMPILSTLARKVAPHYRWDDIVLPPDTIEQLREMCGMVEHRHLVYETWGFDRKLALGKGVMALFAGQSGTGKTMAADVIAGALGLDLYKIDLSGVVSKYIGETEKNLGSIFSEAENSNAILFFDEADALFGKRSEVKDAHDRYANIETAYLLQRMEEYSGAVILATNLKMNLDEAFSRRLHFVIDFPMPEEDDRRRIWISTMPADLPRTPDIDFVFLARQFKISGGNIRNIVLAGAFIAASEGVAMGMAHLIRATRREYQKLGRMVTEAEFGQYVALLRG